MITTFMIILYHMRVYGDGRLGTGSTRWTVSTKKTIPGKKKISKKIGHTI